jgi:hypothetical protein
MNIPITNVGVTITSFLAFGNTIIEVKMAGMHIVFMGVAIGDNFSVATVASLLKKKGSNQHQVWATHPKKSNPQFIWAIRIFFLRDSFMSIVEQQLSSFHICLLLDHATINDCKLPGVLKQV